MLSQCESSHRQQMLLSSDKILFTKKQVVSQLKCTSSYIRLRSVSQPVKKLYLKNKNNHNLRRKITRVLEITSSVQICNIYIYGYRDPVSAFIIIHSKIGLIVNHNIFPKQSTEIIHTRPALLVILRIPYLPKSLFTIVSICLCVFVCAYTCVYAYVCAAQNL